MMKDNGPLFTQPFAPSRRARRNDFDKRVSLGNIQHPTLEEVAAEDEREVRESFERLLGPVGDILCRVLPAVELACTVQSDGPTAGAHKAATMPIDTLAFGLVEGARGIAQALDLYADMYANNPRMFRRPSPWALRTLPGPHAEALWLEQRPAGDEETRRYADYMAALYREAAIAINQAVKTLSAGTPLEFRNPDTGVNIPTALYFWYDADGALLYIGITGDLATRQSSHAKRSSWAEFAARSTVQRYPSRSAAEAAEKAAIEAERPLFNHVYNDTPEARARLVAYLIEHGRADLLAPAVLRG